MNFRKLFKRAGSLGMVLLFLICVSPFQTFAQEEVQQITSTPVGVSVSFEITLELDGDEPESPGSFTFVLEPAEETNPLPEESTEVTIEGAGTVSFGDITFTEPGDYVYNIRQKTDEALENYRYDDSVYVMQVSVTTDSSISYKMRNNYLQATITGNLEGEDEKAGIILFSNSYAEPTPTPTPTLTPTVTPVATSTPSAGTTPGTSGTSGTSSPKTGDNTDVTLWMMLLCAAAAGMSGSVWYRKRTRKHSRR
jgi:pilin isopeptide linkage protein/LPXTG-motif cell wall-anchored protein